MNKTLSLNNKENGKRITWTVPGEKAGKRLDLVLSQLPLGISRSQWKRLIKKGMITIKGFIPNPHYILKTNDKIEALIPQNEPLDLEPEEIPLEILFEDDSLLIINKPAGLVIHPGAGHSRHTLVNALLYHYPELSCIGERQRPGIVHRLDKDTSGLIMVVKTQRAYKSLSAQLKERKVHRVYKALVHGPFSKSEGDIHTQIGRHPRNRKKMSIHPQKGRYAITRWKLIENFSNFAFLELSLKTGRTHQIRVHMSYIHHPVVGDKVYGRGKIPPDSSSRLRKAIKSLPGQALHAQTIGFQHPDSGKYLEFSSPLPIYMQKILDILKGMNT